MITTLIPAVLHVIESVLRPTASRAQRRQYDRVVKVLEHAQQMLERRRRRNTLPLPTALGHVMPRPSKASKAWGLHLRYRRERAGLTRAQLAVLSGVADSTIRNLEVGRNRPSLSVMMRLQLVEALRLPEESSPCLPDSVGPHTASE